MHAEEEVEEDVDGRDPADVPRVVGTELVRLPVCLEEAQGGYQAEGAHYQGEGSEDHEPGSGAAFGEGVVVAGVGGGDCFCVVYMMEESIAIVVAVAIVVVVLVIIMIVVVVLLCKSGVRKCGKRSWIL